MSVQNLLKKSDDNYATGAWAESNKFFDTAISRYYYSLYEKIIYISKKQGFYSRPPSGKDSHIFTIEEIQKNLAGKLSPQETTQLAALRKLKSLRTRADYEEKRVENIDAFNHLFKFYFNSINAVLDKLIQ